MGKNNLLLAIKELEAEGLTFDIEYSRGPFFLKGDKRDVDAWYASMGLPNDTPRFKVDEYKRSQGGGFNDAPMDALYTEAGLSPRNTQATDWKIWTETMTAHRISQYAATESPEKGELLWAAISRRFFMGKDTDIRPIRLDSHELLMECASDAGLNLDEARRVLEGNTFEQQVNDMVSTVRAIGVNSIPLFVFELEGMVQGPWQQNPRNATCRIIHHGSGNKAIFCTILEQLHSACPK